MSWTEKEREFLIGLEALTRKTGIRVFGCGCCGSPSLDTADITSEKSGYGQGFADVTWIDESDSYDWKEYGENIVK